jgi:hypothetical protein
MDYPTAPLLSRLQAIDASGFGPIETPTEPEPGDELQRMTARALRAEGIIAAVWRRLDDYRERGQAMPSYAELVRLLQG